MADDNLVLSASGTWGLRHTTNYDLNSAGYGNGGWAYELIEIATGKVLKTWTGYGSQSPWDSWSSGVRNISWDGDMLRIEHSPPAGGPLPPTLEECISVADALARQGD